MYFQMPRHWFVYYTLTFYIENADCWDDPAVADTLLWKDLKQTLTAVLILVSIYYNFVATGSTIITALSKALLVSSVFLFLHGILPEKM